jgi:hypothetical protein
MIALPPGSTAGRKQLKSSRSRDREPPREGVAVRTHEISIVARVEEKERQAVGVAVTQLDRQAALEGLAVARPGLGFDRMPRARAHHQPVPGPEVGVARERHLRREP